MTANTPAWHLTNQEVTFSEQPLLMGIVNVTPDSFSDGGSFNSFESAVKHGLQLAEDGAAILDVGGESTRPGAEPVSAEEELKRVVPVIEELAKSTDVPISIDTTKAAVAAAAMNAGANIINDISGLTFDPDMLAVCRDTEAGIVCMHIQGTPQTMQDDPHYDDVVVEVGAFLSERMDAMVSAGISAERIVFDPGIGFGKTAEHNLQLMHAIPQLHLLGRPLLIGHSRKRFLKKILGRDVEERSAGTLGVSIALAEAGVDILRVHDVRAVSDALTAWRVVSARS
ncbi:dihydropteroate synthase [Calycomorphotria hydatis]|uniref:Dihydropteroate synthase n=1 Tax=Calycomorphotria hydatis TaxID=2528027 RepID=A0A517T397_9PLAN|nr:dihydropteroate synthase [Calycomorphotria hydatis]QDT62854.1 Dihydropteroate synthase [Calycomorphotria hydatis]